MKRRLNIFATFFIVFLISATILFSFQNCSSGFAPIAVNALPPTALSPNSSSSSSSSSNQPGSTGSTQPPATPTAPGTPQAAGACTQDGVSVASGDSKTFYFTQAATAASGCASETRACANGHLSGSAAYAACTPEPADGIELIADPLDKTGFTATDACPSVYDNVGSGNCANFVTHDAANPLFPNGGRPKWTIQQWGSKSSLPTASSSPYGNGYMWGNSDKHFAVFPGGIFEMGIDGNSDWGGKYRQTTDRPGWPSFYYGYAITSPGDLANGSGSINKMANLNFNFDAYLTNENRNQMAGYDPNQNSVIFVIYFTVQNLNQNSPGFGQYIWLGVPVYNDLERSPGAYVNVDSFGSGLGTNMLIYSVPYAQFSSVSIWDLQWTHLTKDLLPDAKAAFQVAVQHNMLKDTDMSNYYISGMIVGFEVTGLNVTTLQFHAPSLKVKH